MPLTRRHLLVASAAGPLVSACTTTNMPAAAATPPIVFVHGNGDSAALWMTTLWRFESNGWPRDRLHAIDIPYPLARDDDTRAQEGRSSITDNMRYLAAQVDAMLQRSGAAQVVLVANSRGGNAVRNYIANGGGAAKVSQAVLCGTPNHGVYADAGRAPNAEFNGAGVFLAGLNRPQGPDGLEVTPGVSWLTIRSDNNDKFAQPDGAWIGARGTPTHVAFDGPALKGATNIVIPGIDHRETAYSPAAFDAMFRFIAGRPPVTVTVMPERRVRLDGQVSGYLGAGTPAAAPTNLPLGGATVEVYATDPASGERRGAALHRRTVGADGAWGPFDADGAATHEFVVTAPGHATTHVYRSPFPRSSSLVHFRAERIADGDKDAAALVTLVRPRGYFGVPRDRIELDGRRPPPGIPSGVAGVASSRLKLTDAAPRSVTGTFNDERIVARVWPLGQNETTVLELTY